MSYPLAADILGINVLEVCAQKCLKCPGYKVVISLTEKVAPPSPAPAALVMPHIQVKQREAGGQRRREPRALMAQPLDR